MRRLFAAIGLLLAFAGTPAVGQGDGDRAHWVGTWASSQQIPEGRNALPPSDLEDATLRQVVRVSLGGARIRIRISNLFGTEPLRVESVHVARSADPATARIEPGSNRRATFSGDASITIPAGAEYVSDPIDLAVPPLGHLAVSLYFPMAPARQTGHPAARATSHFVHGNRAADPDLTGARTIPRWYQLAGVDVIAPADAAAIVTFGDSITDGYGVAPNSDRRWPDFLARRLQADPATRHLSVLNHGIGGNRVLRDGTGPNALARFERDVLSLPGVRFLILLEGVNDLGGLTRNGPVGPEGRRRFVAEMLAAYRQMVQRARARGIRAIGATILPYGGSSTHHEDAEAARQAINAWIRAPGSFDAVVDFDAVMRDPANPVRLRAAFDSGDGLHPSITGYQAMAGAVPPALFLSP